MAKPPVHIIGVPLDLGAGRRGVDMGPSALRIAGLDREVAELGYPVVDQGDLVTAIPETQGPGDEKKKYMSEIARVCQVLHDAALGALLAGGFPLVLGGDHSVAAGSIAASANHARQHGGEIGLLWIDAHADMNTPATTISGNVHGMPLAAVLGGEPVELSAIGGFCPKVRPERTVLVGLRNLDAREREMLRASRVHVFTMKDIDRMGIAAVTEQALARTSDGTSGLHVSLDLDVCDPLVAPGVGTPVKGGLGYREAHMVMEMIADCGRMTALDVVEVNPILDDRNSTAILATELALSALGRQIL